MPLRRHSFFIYGQLVRENNKALDKTFVYSYNGIGNISSVKEYAYTTEATPSGTASTKSFGYDILQPDILCFLGLKRITCDSLGYVKTYNGWTYTSDKGKLVSMQKSVQSSYTSTYTFTYDAYGRRTQKKHIYTPGSLTQVDYIKAETTGYTYDNSGRLVSERCVSIYNDNSTETKEFTYLYDESGIVGTMLSKNGATATPYYYRRNLQGDVIGIYDTAGTKVGGYAYDAWGNCTVTLNTNGIAVHNPIRYRGYYYDEGTKLYYLNARYYCPELHRFISPDDTSYLDPETPNGLNLYCYCNNDPVNYADPSGHSVIASAVIIGAIIGGFTSFAFSFTTELIHEKGDLSAEDWWQVAASTIIGAAEGALLIIAPGASMLICSLSSAIDTAIYEAIDGSSIQKILINSAISAFFGAAAGANSRDFIKSKELLLQVLDAKRIMNSNVRPLVIKEAKKTYTKAKKRVLKSTFLGLIDDATYGALEYIASESVGIYMPIFAR